MTGNTHINTFLTIIVGFKLLLISNIAIAQSIKGQVIDSQQKESIPGVSIIFSNTLIGTTTDMDGRFFLKDIADGAESITFSCIGYKKQTIQIEKFKKDTIIKLSPSDIPLKEVVISTTKNPLRAFDQSTAVSSTRPTAIIDHPGQDINGIISREPSISLVGAAYHRAISIRGLARKRVLMLIDGQRISSERNPGPPGSFINPLDVKNIEILRGPYSTLYGSDAVGGLINIITKDYKKPISNPYIGGCFQINGQTISKALNANLMLNTQISDKLFLHITAGSRKADSYNDAKGKEVAGTNYAEKSLTAKASWQINQKHFLQASGLISLADSIGKPAFNDSINALHPNDDHYKISLYYQWSNISSILSEMNIRASVHRHEITARIYNYRSTIYGRVMNQSKNLYNDDLIYQHDFNFTIGTKFSLLCGADFYQRDGIHIDEHKRAYAFSAGTGFFQIGELLYDGPQDTSIHNSYQRSLGFFAQAHYIISKKTTINGGLRWNKFRTMANLIRSTQEGPPYDYSKNIHETKIRNNNAISGNIGINIHATKNISIRGNIGQAFRAPSTKELFINTMTPGGMNFCNPDLIPERSLNIDLGINVLFKENSNISLSVFSNKINDMIILQWDSLHTSGHFKNKNALIYGGELCYDFSFNNSFTLHGNISYVKGEEKDGEALMDIPPIQIKSEARYFLLDHKLFFALCAVYNSKQNDIATGDIPTDSFICMDALSGWQINKLLRINISVSNLFNCFYREHYQFAHEARPGRSFNAGLRINF